VKAAAVRISRQATQGTPPWLTPVTDTHALVFHAAGGGSSEAKPAAFRCVNGGKRSSTCRRRDVEINLLARAVRISLQSSAAFFEDLFSNPAYQPLDTTGAGDVPTLRFTRDRSTR
jgi:hypothetical protein